MVNHYTTPEAEVVLLSEEDVIRTSGTLKEEPEEDDPNGGWGPPV